MPPAPFLGAMRVKDSTEFYEDYELLEEVGRGSYGVVYKSRNRITHQVYACKIIEKNQKSLNMENFLIEVNVHSEIAHPGIVNLERVYESPSELYLLCDFVDGGTLIEELLNKHPDGYSERSAAQLFSQIVESVAYLHGENIVHRDLKAENILLGSTANANSSTDHSRVKIGDFGFARKLAKGEMLYKSAGTPEYVAPEILMKKGHDTKADMWSLGVLLYAMLSGCMPFVGRDDQELYRSICRGRFFFLPEYFAHVSDEARDLIRSLLRVNPQERLSAASALEHPWIRNQHLNSVERVLPSTSCVSLRVTSHSVETGLKQGDQLAVRSKRAHTYGPSASAYSAVSRKRSWRINSATLTAADAENTKLSVVIQPPSTPELSETCSQSEEDDRFSLTIPRASNAARSSPVHAKPYCASCTPPSSLSSSTMSNECMRGESCTGCDDCSPTLPSMKQGSKSSRRPSRSISSTVSSVLKFVECIQGAGIEEISLLN